MTADWIRDVLAKVQTRVSAGTTTADNEERAVDAANLAAVAMAKQYVDEAPAGDGEEDDDEGREDHLQMLEALQLQYAEEEEAASGAANEGKKAGLFATHLAHTHTTAGRRTLWRWLERPLRSQAAVERRRLARTAATSSTSLLRLRATLGTMEDGWRSLSWCWDDGESKQEVMRQVEFTGIAEPLNRVPVAQTAYHHLRVAGMPLLHCVSPLVPILISYLILRFSGASMSFRDCWNISSGMMRNTFWWGDDRPSSVGGMLMQAIKYAWYLLFIVNAVVLVYHSYRHYKLLAHVHAHVLRAAQWIRTAVQMEASAAASASAASPSPSPSPAVDAVVEWAARAPSVLSIFTHAHEYLQVYRLLQCPTLRARCKALVRLVGEVDAHQSVAALMQKHPDLWCEPTIVPASDGPPQPRLEIEACAHPALGASQSRPDVCLNRRVVVLTGANASGKSTVIRMTLLNVLLAQSFGVACAKRMHWTPFGLVRGYLLTPDDCGRESLFQAQVRRIEAYIAAAEDAKSALSLIFVDEIFNSTNPVEAMLLSYVYAQRLGRIRQSRAIISTHYPMLTQLAMKTPKRFANWCMRDGYDLRLNGICKRSSAIEMVQSNSKILKEKDYAQLKKGYRRLYAQLHLMHLDDDDDGVAKKQPKKKQQQEEQKQEEQKQDEQKQEQTQKQEQEQVQEQKQKQKQEQEQEQKQVQEQVQACA